VIFASSAVICLSSFDFVFEIANFSSDAIRSDTCNPSFLAAVPAYAFIVRTESVFGFSGVSIVLGDGGQTKIGLSIVKAIMIDVVNNEAIADMAMAVMSS